MSDNWIIGLATIGLMLLIAWIYKKAKKADDRRNDPDNEEFRQDMRDALKIEPEPDTSLDGTKIMSEPYKVED